MPIYEFYCQSCNVIFNFFSPSINTTKVPACPRCKKSGLKRLMSTFATIGSAEENTEDPLAGLDETRMEQAFESLMREAGTINEEDPRQMASLMRKFTSQTGISLGDAMEEAISRMEAGEDPEQVEREMGDLVNEDDFSLESLRKKAVKSARKPAHDEKLYRL